MGSPVDGLVVPFLLDHLGGEVIRGAAEGVGQVGDELGEPEIGEFDVAVRGDEDILGFEITVDDGDGMQVVDRHRYLCRVELGHGVRESLEKG